MTMPGMLDMNQTRTPRRSMRSRFITKMFAFGIGAAVLGGGLAIAQNAEADADRPTNSEIAKVRALGGIPPCKWEDGSGQNGICWWDSRNRGNRDGDVVVLVPVKGADDKKVVVLINR